MDNTNFTFAACLGCHFVPFCATECKPKPETKQINFSVKRLLQLKRKEVLCLPQHKFQNFYAIQKGALKTYQMEATGKELIRGFYFAGEILGYEAIATGHYLFSAIALTDTLICEIPYDNFLKQVHSDPSLQKHSLHLISQQLNAGSYLASTTAEQRLAAFLIDLSRRLHPTEGPTVFNLPLSRQDIGSYLRLTAETISRLLSKLQKIKVLVINQKRLHILEPEKLQLIAEGLL
jgi:CRP/FNR family transcriptional regulator